MTRHFRPCWSRTSSPAPSAPRRRPLSRRPDDRRRLLRSFSRDSATPPSLVIEWTPDGADYQSLGTSTELDYERGWPLLHAVLDQSEGTLTRREILRRWPDSALAPSRLTLWRWLGRAVDERRVLQKGRGTRRDPFRYQLPGMIDRWQQKFLETFFKRLEPAEKDQGPQELAAPLSPDDAAPPAAPVFRPEEEHPETVPLLEGGPETPPSGSPSPVPVPSPAPDRPAPPPEPSVCLPYPWNIVNPAHVPEEVWQRARAATRNG